MTFPSAQPQPSPTTAQPQGRPSSLRYRVAVGVTGLAIGLGGLMLASSGDTGAKAEPPRPRQNPSLDQAHGGSATHQDGSSNQTVKVSSAESPLSTMASAESPSTTTEPGPTTPSTQETASSVPAPESERADQPPDQLAFADDAGAIAAVSPEHRSLSSTSISLVSHTLSSTASSVPVTQQPTIPMSSTTTAGSTTTAPGVRLRLSFEENFDVLDAGRWRPEFSTYGDGNNELQCYLPELVSVEDGALTLRAKRQRYECLSGDVRQVTSGMVRSSGITFEPGQRIEFRARMNVADTSEMGGLWPAFWASSWGGGGWPKGGELDVLEWLSRDPSRSHHTVHWLNGAGRHDKWGAKSSANLTNRWYTFAFQWTRTELTWFVDDMVVAKVDPRTFDVHEDENPFTSPNAMVHQLKINLALGGNWGGELGSTALDLHGSTSYQIDYVRVYDLIN